MSCSPARRRGFPARVVLVSICAASFPLCAASSRGSSGGAEWPHWRGPARDGKSPDVGLLKSWPSGGPRLLWRRDDIGTGYANVAVAGGKVYTAGLVGDEMVLTAFDLGGKPVWRKAHGPAWKKNYPGSRATPTVNEGRLYFLSGPGLLACYDARTAAKVWSVDVTRQFGGRPGGWGYAESVLIYKNVAVVTPGGGNFMVALDKATGRPAWTSTGLSDRPAYSSCIVFEHGGVPMIATMTSKSMVGLSARDGRFLWRNDRAAGSTAVVPTPAYADGYVFGASGYGNGGACVKLSVAGGRVTAPQAWETDEMVCHHGGFVILEGHIYGNHGGGWNCLELATGRKKWGERGVGKGSICYADGMLYTFSENGGRMGLVEARPDRFSMTGGFSAEGSGKSWAHPVVVGGRLYLRYARNLYAYDVRGPGFRDASLPAEKPKPKPSILRPRPRPRPAVKRTPAPARPDTPDERARRLWYMAKSFLANDATGLARKKLEEIVEKYPDTKYAPLAREKLKSIY